MKNNGFIKITCATPKVKVANPMYNIEQILASINAAMEKSPSIIVFPELSVTSYSCGDLFFQGNLYIGVEEAIKYFLANNKYDGITVLGAPISVNSVLYNCAIVIQKDKILGIVPKYYLPNANEFYEKRWFNVGQHIVKSVKKVNFIQKDIPFGNIIFRNTVDKYKFGIEICEDMWAPISPGNHLALNGAQVIINISASNETIGKDAVRRSTVIDHSRRNVGAYVYCSAGVHESTSETVFSGHNIIAENGVLLRETESFKRGNLLLFADIDLNKIRFKRRNSTSLRDAINMFFYEYQTVDFEHYYNGEFYEFEKAFDKTPFVPKVNELKTFRKIVNLQTAALAKRLEFIGIESVVIGVSGGLDSTLALLAAVRTFDELGIDRKNIIGVTMPGLGTSARTRNNALELMKLLKITYKEIDICSHTSDHFNMIDHDFNNKDITYENTQARIRTSVLMNLANKHNAIVLGTGNMSEMALGWCTYNGDHMSMYGINTGLPKTLVKFMVNMYAKYDNIFNTNSTSNDLSFAPEVLKVINDIINTPISPELTGADQSTEEIIGDYEINDFIMHRFLSCGDSKMKIYHIMKDAFENLSDIEIQEYIDNFISRFMRQQYKRATMPEGPKVIDISLSPRSDLKMPSDVEV